MHNDNELVGNRDRSKVKEILLINNRNELIELFPSGLTATFILSSPRHLFSTEYTASTTFANSIVEFIPASPNCTSAMIHLESQV